ncbi:hypothetical protein HYX70_03600 [Candidatus Saccharibacteria bacterium]|nr:hypothetical protein [Candidatus Saccharibacteria bacterium]
MFKAMKWKKPPLNKVYEALAVIADGRIKITGNTAQIVSSSGNKTYQVIYSPKKNAITANDNGSFWQGYLGYTCIAFLLKKGLVEFDHGLAKYLKGFMWKDMAGRFKHDYNQIDAFVEQEIAKKHPNFNLAEFHKQLEKILADAMKLDLNRLRSPKKPPAGY